MKYDQVLVYLGEFGTAQKRVTAWVSFFILLTSWDNLVGVFVMYQPAHRCQLPDYPNDTYEVQSDRHLYLINQSVPRNDLGQFSSCLLYKDADQSNRTEPSSANESEHSATRNCEKWVFDRAMMRSTLSEKLSIVCQNSVMRANQYMVSDLGKLLGVPVVGVISDRLGRKLGFLLFLLIEVAAMFGSVFISNWASLLVLRFIIMFGNVGTYLILYVLATELIGPSRRTIPGAMTMVQSSVSQLYMVVLAYFLRDWQMLTLAMSVPCLFFFSFFWILPESPRWLLSRGRDEEARRIIQKIAKVNKVDLDDEALENITFQEHKGESVMQLFRQRVFCGRYFIVTFAWMCTGTVFSGVTYNVGNLSGDLFLNFAVVELVGVAGYTSGMLLVDRLGRRFCLSGALVGTGVVCLACVAPVLLQSAAGSAAHVAMLLLSNVGKFLTSGAYVAVYAFAAELAPTPYRAGCMALASSVARIGGMLGSYLADLSLYIPGAVGRALPPLIFGVVGVVSGGLVLLLPETLHRRLPETVQDALDIERLPVSKKVPASPETPGQDSVGRQPCDHRSD